MNSFGYNKSEDRVKKPTNQTNPKTPKQKGWIEIT